MKRLLLLLIIGLTLTSCSRNDDKKQPTEPNNTLATFEPIDAFEQNTQLGRGINLGGFEGYYEGDWGDIIQEETLHIIYDAGFNTIRLPVRWAPHAMDVFPHIIDKNYFERIDWVIETSLKIGLNVVLNIHHFDDLFNDPDATEEKYLAIWDQIAKRYKDYPNNLVFELLNEPHGALDSSKWNTLLVKVLDKVRLSNPERNVIIGPASWNNYNFLSALELPQEDRHIIVTFHFYDPFSFTHQGAIWVENPPPVGTTWLGSRSETTLLDGYFDMAENWSITENRPMFLGEFGSNNTADMNSRHLWTKYVAREAESRSFSWAFYAFSGGMGAYDYPKKEWRELLYKALIPTN